nr:MAG TPA: hypothetical protein [Caudoviricetes sp.]
MRALGDDHLGHRARRLQGVLPLLRGVADALLGVSR